MNIFKEISYHNKIAKGTRRFAIGIPTLNRYDLLKPSLEKYLIDFPDTEIFVLDNGNQNIKKDFPNANNLTIFEFAENIGVAASWNLLCLFIYTCGYDNALIINDDVYLGYGSEVVEEAIDNMKVGLVQSQFSFSVFLINALLFYKIGIFDESFYPAYYEDSDFLYRMKLQGIRQDLDYTLNASVLAISSTREKAPELVDYAMQDNRVKYIEKWGGSPLLETFTTPYNNQE
jgi:GT2 family glycosyltransferase